VNEVLYRKYRPQRFAEVAGQDAVTRTLRNAISSGNMAHAYLFCGPRGTGKTTLGRLMAKVANCASPVDGEPCDKCESCTAFNEGRAMDFIEQDAASHNSVEDIRQLRENVALTPMAGGRKVYLLDEVHMLSTAAQNALLKTLEEPPPHIIFVLATTEAHKVSSTIVSRCQRFDLRRIPMDAAVERLAFVADKEGFTIDRASLEEIARAATGSLRDGINALEQVASYYGKSPTREQVQEALGLSVDARSGQLARLAIEGDLGGALRLIATVRDEGVDIKQFSRHVVKYLRGLLLAKAGATDALELPAELAAEVKAEAHELSREDIVAALQTFGRIDWRDDAAAAGGSLPLELALVDFVSVAPAMSREHAPPPMAAKPAPARPAEARPEPEFSIPAAEMTTAETTVGTAKVKAASPEKPVVVPLDPAPVAPKPAGEAVPAPVAMSTAEPSGDLVELVRSALKDTGNISALLNGSCEVKSTEGDTVVLGFYHTFHLERIEESQHRRHLDEAFSKLLGRQVKVTYEHAPKQQEAGQRKGGHLAQAAREMGARAVPRDNQAR
jgi:DNA polymerase-3 subunit gamma/tau